jgi:hypothetical protein
MCCRLWVWNDLVLLDGNSPVGCECGKDRLCWTVIVLWDVALEQIGCIGR